MRFILYVLWLIYVYVERYLYSWQEDKEVTLNDKWVYTFLLSTINIIANLITAKQTLPVIY